MAPAEQGRINCIIEHPRICQMPVHGLLLLIAHIAEMLLAALVLQRPVCHTRGPCGARNLSHNVDARPEPFVRILVPHLGAAQMSLARLVQRIHSQHLWMMLWRLRIMRRSIHRIADAAAARDRVSVRSPDERLEEPLLFGRCQRLPGLEHVKIMGPVQLLQKCAIVAQLDRRGVPARNGAGTHVDEQLELKRPIRAALCLGARLQAHRRRCRLCNTLLWCLWLARLGRLGLGCECGRWFRRGHHHANAVDGKLSAVEFDGLLVRHSENPFGRTLLDLALSFFAAILVISCRKRNKIRRLLARHSRRWRWCC
eukprot:comp21118_c0_seq1/m.44619 comp21118_c0_seq1/g.44619  ORF comp21118_c0_seq1/g.44619 comp21118_c0_seq1/m.44619 type:complete len:312 (-) comp21118_c0_seq1:101-1036(-)